jgi:hypothetical protein
MRARTPSLIAAATAVVCTVPLVAQEGDASAEMAATMEAYERAGTPGEFHETLGQRVGEWDAEVRFWSEPGGEPSVMEATATIEWVMDGRFVRETVVSEFMGQPFRGVGYTGYNNLTGEYEGSWMDNHSTALYRYTGERDDRGRLVFVSESVDPLSGQKVKERSVWELVSDDEMVARSYRLEDGEEILTMELRYTRRM